MHLPQHYDIFCTVIDNYGDIGTAWRLAKQLQQQQHKTVRLWVDNLEALSHLVPQAQLTLAQQQLEDITVCHWTTPLVYHRVADVVIEAFGCTLPANYRQDMIEQGSICINLEYFSCENWVQGCHGLRSFQHDGLIKYFFFPGIMPGTGGVLYESDLLIQQSKFIASDEQQQRWRQHWKLTEPNNNSIRICLFGYENSALPNLLTQLADYDTAIDVYLPYGKLIQNLTTRWPERKLGVGETIKEGNLTLHIIPFLPQAEFDRLLWLCDLNFIRGEESLIRGLLAAKPVVWHIYPTADNAHIDKLNAWMHVYQMPSAWQQLQLAWNKQQPLTSLYTVLNQLSTLKQQAQYQRQQIMALGELSTNLVSFIESKV